MLRHALCASLLFMEATLAQSAIAADGLAPPPPAEAFAQLPAMDHVRMSQDGRLIAWVVDSAGSPIVVVFELASGRFLRKISAPEGFKLRRLNWSSGSTLLITLSTHWEGRRSSGRESHEIYRIIALDSHDGPARNLLMNSGDRRNVTGASVVGTHTGNPHTVLMASLDFYQTLHQPGIGSRLTGGRKDEGWAYSLFEVDTRTGQGQVVEVGTPFTDQWVVDATGKAVARSEWNPEASEYRILARNQNGGWERIHSATSSEPLQLAGVMPDGEQIVALGPNGGSHARAWTLPRGGGTPKLLHDFGDRDAEYTITDRFSGAVVGLALGGLEPAVHWFDPRLQEMQEATSKAFAGRLTQIFDRSLDYLKYLVQVEGPAEPPRYFLVDRSKGTADLVGEAYPRLAGMQLGERKAIHYRARDGQLIPAYLTLPPGRDARTLPAVILPHGGPRSRDEPGFDWWSQFLATRGYVVLQPQFRGSTGFGATIEQGGIREWGRTMQDDISDGVEYLVSEGVVDAGRICIVGASYGGYAALAGVTLEPGRYRCAVSVNGIADLPAMYGHIKQQFGAESDTVHAWKSTVGTISDDNLKKFSPMRAVDQITAPILLIHGTEDTVVPFSQSASFARALAAKDKPHELLKLPGEDHWLSRSENRIRVMQAMEGFLARQLASH